MIRHLLMFRWTEDSAPEDRVAAVKALLALGESVPSLRSITIQEALRPGEQSYDALLEAHFDDEAGYESYLGDASHIGAWTGYLQPVCAGLASIQLA